VLAAGCVSFEDIEGVVLLREASLSLNSPGQYDAMIREESLIELIAR
jgi:hypothetical protein